MSTRRRHTTPPGWRVMRVGETTRDGDYMNAKFNTTDAKYCWDGIVRPGLAPGGYLPVTVLVGHKIKANEPLSYYRKLP